MSPTEKLKKERCGKSHPLDLEWDVTKVSHSLSLDSHGLQSTSVRGFVPFPSKYNLGGLF